MCEVSDARDDTTLDYCGLLGPTGQVIEETRHIINEGGVNGILCHREETRKTMLIQDSLMSSLGAQKVTECGSTAL